MQAYLADRFLHFARELLDRNMCSMHTLSPRQDCCTVRRLYMHSQVRPLLKWKGVLTVFDKISIADINYKDNTLNRAFKWSRNWAWYLADKFQKHSHNPIDSCMLLLHTQHCCQGCCTGRWQSMTHPVLPLFINKYTQLHSWLILSETK